jgi:hypothetical protein
MTAKTDDCRVMAAELVTSVRQSVTFDWTVRESARAKIRVMVRRILLKHGYPPRPASRSPVQRLGGVMWQSHRIARKISAGGC